MADPKFELPRLIIGEGPEDVAFFQRLIESRGLPRAHVRHTGGKDPNSAGNTRFGRALAAASLNPGFPRLNDVVVVSDNDADPDASFKNVRDQVIRAGLQAAPAPLERGPGRPAITIVMLPLGGGVGCLESTLIEAARSEDQNTAAQVDHLLALMRADQWAPARYEKAWLRINLALRCARDPFVFLGNVFRDGRHDGLIPLQHASFDPLAAILQELA